MSRRSSSGCSQDEIQEHILDLEKRVKELDCLSRITAIFEKGISLEGVFQEVVELIPSGWNYPEITCARIIFEDKAFQTPNFRVTEWGQSGEIIVHGRQLGVLEVFYIEKGLASYKDPFLEEETILLNDISERLGKVAERKLSEDMLHSVLETENELDTIYKSSPVVAFLWRNEHNWPVEFVSENISQFGYSVNDFTSGKLLYGDMVHPDDLERLQSEVLRYSEKGNDYFSLEYRIITRAGEVRWVVDRSLARRDMVGNISHYHGILIDITEHKLAEDALKSSEEKYSTLVEKGNDGIIIIQDGLLKFANSKALEVTNYTKEEATGSSFLEFIAPECREMVMERYVKLLENDPTIQPEYEVYILSKDGNKIQFEVNDSLIEHEGRPATMAIIRDITQRKKVEAELKRYAEELKRSNELKDLFTDILRHDLLNPAGVVRGFTEILADTEVDGKKLDLLNKIKRNNDNLIDIIECAAKFEKLETVEDIPFEKLDIAPLFKIVLDNFESHIKQKKILVESGVDGPYLARANPVIEEVFSNLLSNAIKYSNEGGRVIIDIIDSGPEWRVEVTDFGEGIPAESKPQVFDRFKRVGKNGVKGTGLGLAIVKRIVDLHGGNVGVHDNPQGRGSVFWLTLEKA